MARLKSGQSDRTRKASKSWTQSTRQQQYNGKNQLIGYIQEALSFWEEDGFKLCGLEVENTKKENVTPSNIDKVHSALYVKDKFSLSDTGFHVLSMLSDLPNSRSLLIK